MSTPATYEPRSLEPELYAPVIHALRRAGLPVGIVEPVSLNVGDKWIYWATSHILRYYRIPHYMLDTNGGPDSKWAKCRSILWPGGGNVGSMYTPPVQQRMAIARKTPKRKVIVGPFTANDASEDLGRYFAIFARDHVTQGEYYPSASLVPCPTLLHTLRPAKPIQPDYGNIWLRTDVEGATDVERLKTATSSVANCRRLQVSTKTVSWWNIGLPDPTAHARGPKEYHCLAALAPVLVTDRMHFAIAGWLQGVEVQLLTGSYHKAKSVYETWLCDKEGITFREDWKVGQ